MKSLKEKTSSSCKSLCLTGQHVHSKGILKIFPCQNSPDFGLWTVYNLKVSVDSRYNLKVAAPWQIYTMCYQMTCDFTIRNKHIRAQECDSAPRI